MLQPHESLGAERHLGPECLPGTGAPRCSLATSQVQWVLMRAAEESSCLPFSENDFQEVYFLLRTGSKSKGSKAT